MKVRDISPRFTEKNFADFVNQFNAFARSIGLENMNAQIIDNISLPANTSVTIGHGLKSIPKYRIVLRQTSGATIVDGDDTWTDTFISLRNSDTSDDAIVSILLIRE